MSGHYDVVVVGGGVAGCSIAYHLADKGAKVAVLERGPVGGQASTVAAGMLAAQEEASAPDAFFEICRRSQSLFATLVPEVSALSMIDPEWETTGVWRAAVTPQEVEELKEKSRWQAELGLPVEWQDAARVAEVHPGLAPTLGAIYCPGDGQINSGKWVQALAEAARRRGVRFMDYTEVQEFNRDGKRLAAIRTAEGPVTGGQFVVAAGAWTLKVLDNLGIALPLEPVKGQLLILGGVPRAFRGPVFARPGYIVPKADGRLIIGATVEHVGFHTRPTLAAQRTLAEWAARWCPGMTQLPTMEFQAGLRPGTADGWPILGRLWEFDNLFVAAGHYRNGILLSPFTGRYMADGILDGRWDPLGAPFTPERFLKTAAKSQ